MTIKRVRDFNDFFKIKWIRPPHIKILDHGNMMAFGLISRGKRKLEVVWEVFDGFKPIHYMDGKVLHWNHDWSKAFIGREEYTGIIK